MNNLRFIETIKIKDGVFCNLSLHNERAKRTVAHYYGKPFDLSLTNDIIPSDMRLGTVKCRVLYSNKIESITFEPYIIRSIFNLRLVYDNDIDYSYKSENRDKLQYLLSLKGDCDEILIVKGGYITDTSYTNVVFENSEGLFTPSTPLLEGVMRHSLIETGIIKVKSIMVDNLSDYTHIHLINAMLGLEDNISLSTQKIVID